MPEAMTRREREADTPAWLRRHRPHDAAQAELRQFRAGGMLGPLTRLAMELQNDEMNLYQAGGGYDPDAWKDIPHYPLPKDELRQANPLRDRHTGKLIEWVPWSITREDNNG